MKQRRPFSVSHILSKLAVSLILAFVVTTGSSAQIPATAVVPTTIPEPARSELNKERRDLQEERERLRARAIEQNAKCKPAPPGDEAKCKTSQDKFNEDVRDFIWDVKNFNLTVKGHLTILAMNDLAKKLPWTAEERARLDKALHELSSDGSTTKTREAIDKVWSDVLSRDASFATEANKGKGPGMPGAGTQTKHQDCAVFALANASGQPYGVVAARLTRLMGEGEWRDAKERENPQKVIEDEGLMGGEVVMMAEVLGRVEIVNSNDFAKTLEGGRTVMVNVFPKGGGAHEVVLSKTFQHDGETWFEMMDSNQGPIRRLYLSHKELMMILKESGVAYSPDPNNTLKPIQ